jgi:hypothetical protein
MMGEFLAAELGRGQTKSRRRILFATLPDQIDALAPRASDSTKGRINWV